MIKSTSIAVAAALLVGGASLSAANAASGHAMAGSAASDTLNLSGKQQKTIWKDMQRHAANQAAPAGFTATVGAAIPAGVSTYPVPRVATRDVPAVKPYRYAMLDNKVVLVNPSDHKIADVVTR